MAHVSSFRKTGAANDTDVMTHPKRHKLAHSIKGPTSVQHPNSRKMMYIITKYYSRCQVIWGRWGYLFLKFRTKSPFLDVSVPELKKL